METALVYVSSGNLPDIVAIVGGTPSAQWPVGITLWSDIKAPPAIGSKVSPKCGYRGAPMKYFVNGTVLRYAVEHGFLYAVVDFPKLPKKYCDKRYVHAYEKPTTCWVAGCDLMTRKQAVAP